MRETKIKENPVKKDDEKPLEEKQKKDLREYAKEYIETYLGNHIEEYLDDFTDSLLEKQDSETIRPPGKVDRAIINYLDQKIYARQKDILKDVTKQVRKKEKTIIRAIKDLTNTNEIIRITFDDFKKYNIKDTHENAVYYALTRINEIRDYLNKLIVKLERSQNVVEKKLILREIGLYETNALFKEKIDNLIVNLELIKDKELLQSILGIIYNHIIRLKIELKDSKTFIDKLKIILKENKENDKHFGDIKKIVICLLANYGEDKEVIDMLKEDVLNCNNWEDYINNYFLRPIPKIIESYRQDLYDFQLKLENKAEFQKVTNLLHIRKEINNRLGITKRMELFEEIKF